MSHDVDRESIIIVWDKDGKFFQTWTSQFRRGAGIDHGKEIATMIGGSYLVVAPETK